MKNFESMGFHDKNIESITLPINYDKSDVVTRRLARNQYCEDQGWKCCHCGVDLRSDPRKDIKNKYINLKIFPKSMFDYPIHLHHDHKTGLTIGAVHAKCNAVLWQYYGD